MNNDFSKSYNDFYTTSILLFALLNAIFSAFLIFHLLYSGIFLLAFSIGILIYYFYNLKRKTTKIANMRVESNVLSNMLSYIPFNISINDLNDKPIISNEEPAMPSKSKILKSLKISDNLEINKIKINNEILSYLCYHNSINDNYHNPVSHINIQFDITNILKDCPNTHLLDDKDRYIYNAFNNSSDGILIFSYENSQPKEYIYSNARLNNMILPYHVSSNILDLFHKSEIERLRCIFSNLSTQPMLFESLMINDSGYFPIEAHANITKINNKDLLILNIRDTSLRKELEHKRDKNRILVVGRNSHSSIIRILHLVLSKIYEHIKISKESSSNIMKSYYDLKDEANTIINAQEQILYTIRDLISFYTPSNIKSLINTKSFIEGIISTLYIKDILNNTTITTIQKGDIKDIYVDEHALKFVLISLINNAIENINIKKGTNFYGKIYITIEGFSEDSIKISIEDNGGGVDDNKIDRIFEIFYSTQENKMGLGLTRAKIVIEDILFGSIKANNTKDGLKIDMTIATK